jgi:glutaminyl-tRNA synthetase
MPTIRGMRRRGFTADALNDFCERVGVTRNANLINVNLLEQCVREDLEKKVNRWEVRIPSYFLRALAVLEPLKITLTNWKDGVKKITAPLHPKEKSRGTREVPFSGVIYIEQSDFRLEDIKVSRYPFHLRNLITEGLQTFGSQQGGRFATFWLHHYM